jgi:ABC-type branched-subunit amino acid transport system substrate-binding protein
MKTPVIIAVVVVVAIVVGSVGYLVGNRSATSENVSTLPTLPATIKIGSLIALTGDLGPVGDGILKGIQLAVKEANENGGIAGRQVKLYQEDTATDPATALEAAKKLVEVDGVKAIVGPLASGEVEGIGAYCNDSKVVVISPSGTSPLLTVDFPDDYIFRTCGSDAFQGKAMADLIIRENKTKVAVLVLDNPYGVGIENQAKKELAGKATIVATVRYDPTKGDFRTELGQIQSANPDAVLYVGYYVDARTMFRQALELGLDSIRWVCAEGVYGQATIQENNVVYTDAAEFMTRACEGTWPAAPAVSNYDAFNARYKAEYGTDATIYSDTAYDATWLEIQAIARAGEYDGAKIKSSLSIVSQFFIGASGLKAFDVNGDQANATYAIWDVEKLGTDNYKFVNINTWPFTS